MSTIPEFLGWCVIVAGSGLGVGALMAAIYFAMAVLFGIYAKKIRYATSNWRAVHEWHKAGRPKWVIGDDNVYRMVPSSGKWTCDEGGEE